MPTNTSSVQLILEDWTSKQQFALEPRSCQTASSREKSPLVSSSPSWKESKRPLMSQKSCLQLYMGCDGNGREYLIGQSGKKKRTLFQGRFTLSYGKFSVLFRYLVQNPKQKTMLTTKKILATMKKNNSLPAKTAQNYRRDHLVYPVNNTVLCLLKT